MDDDTPYDLAIAYESDLRLSDESIVRRSMLAAFKHHHTKRATISVALVDDDHIASLNNKYLGHQGPTDVITFNLGSDRSQSQSDSQPDEIDGEIVISIETASRECETRGHTLDAEVALYAVHGVLHLLGYDDHTEADAQRMHAMEDDILTSIGLKPVYQGPIL